MQKTIRKMLSDQTFERVELDRKILWIDKSFYHQRNSIRSQVISTKHQGRRNVKLLLENKLMKLKRARDIASERCVGIPSSQHFFVDHNFYFLPPFPIQQTRHLILRLFTNLHKRVGFDPFLLCSSKVVNKFWIERMIAIYLIQTDERQYTGRYIHTAVGSIYIYIWLPSHFDWVQHVNHTYAPSLAVA